MLLLDDITTVKTEEDTKALMTMTGAALPETIGQPVPAIAEVTNDDAKTTNATLKDFVKKNNTAFLKGSAIVSGVALIYVLLSD